MTKTFTRKPFTQKVFPLKNVRRQEHGMKKRYLNSALLSKNAVFICFTAKESVVNNVHLVHVYTEKLLSRMQKHVLCEWPVNSEDKKTNSGGLWETIQIMSNNLN